MTLLDDEQKYAEIFTDTEWRGRRSQWPNIRRRGTAQLSFMVSIIILTRHGTQGLQYSTINLSVSATPDKKRLSALAFDFISHASYSYGAVQTFVVFIRVLT